MSHFEEVFGDRVVGDAHEDVYFAEDEDSGTEPGLPEIILGMDSLTERQRFVIELRYGLRDGQPYAQEDIARLMGVSQQAIAGTERRALAALRRVMGVVEPSP